jgi:cation transport ATPase
MVRLSWSLLWRTIVVLAPVGMAISALIRMWPSFGLGPDFELLEPTIVFVSYAAMFIVADSLFHRSPLQFVFGWRLQLATEEWRELSFGMAALMSVIAALNFVVASISTLLWVNFKLFCIPFVLSFGVALLARRIQKARFEATVLRQIEARMSTRT